MKRSILVLLFSLFLIPGNSNAQNIPDFEKLLQSHPEETHVKPVVPEGEKYVPLFKLGEVDEESSKKIIQEIQWAKEDGASRIVIDINSPGGSVSHGFLISKAIEESPIPVTCIVDGTGASMAYYILQSCQERAMTKRSILMIHEPSVGLFMFRGNQSDFANIMERLKTMNKAMTEHLAVRMNICAKEIQKKIARGREWWMNHDDASKWGAIDKIVPNVAFVVESYK